MTNSQRQIIEGFDKFIDEILSGKELLGHSTIKLRDQEFIKLKSLNDKSKLRFIQLMEKANLTR